MMPVMINFLLLLKYFALRIQIKKSTMCEHRLRENMKARIFFCIHDFLNTSIPSYIGSWGKSILYSLENKSGKNAKVFSL